MKYPQWAGLACLTMSFSASAQTMLYGLLDTGIERANNINARGDTALRMPSLTGSFPSRLGLRGAEDLGGGNALVFQLETGLGLDTGTAGQGGRLFGRQSWVGIKGGFGSLTVGRQSNMSFHALVKADVAGPAIHGVTNMDSYIPNARSDNSLAYLGTFGNAVLGASYSFGRDASPPGGAGPGATSCPGEQAGDARACRQATAMLGYDTGQWGIYASSDWQHGGTGATNGLGKSSDTDRRRVLSAYRQFDGVKLGAGWLRRNTVSSVPAASDLYFVGASIARGLWTGDVQYSRLKVRASANVSALYVARLSYHLSRRTALYASLGYIQNHGAAAVAVDSGGTVGKGMRQSGQMLGLRHSF
ncbi:MAG: porin [Sphingomonadaceae bacterium]